MCPYAARLERWVLGTTDADAAAEIQAHLATCAECQAHADQLLGHTHDSSVKVEQAAAPGGAQQLHPHVYVDGNADTLGSQESRHPAVSGGASIPRGAQLGRYMVLECIGAGGMGEVYAAFDPELDRKIALKVIRRGATGSSLSTEGCARLQREAQALARLSHRNVVAVHDVGTVNGQVFIALEFVEGETLKTWLLQPRSPDEVLKLFAAAGEGLVAAHAKGLIHRDFKPDNVLLSHDGDVRVGDFGLARAADDRSQERPADAPTSSSRLEATPLTMVGTVMGTPGYMAPEQYQGLPATDRTDQFSFCVSLYEALYGRRPFAGKSLVELSSAASSGNVPPPPAGTKAPAYLWPILRKGLAPKPDDRHPSLRALLDALARDPRRIALRRAKWAGVVAAIVLAAVGATLVARRRAAVCNNQQARLAGTWDRERRRAVQEAFKSVAGAAGETAFESLAPVLDGYAQAFVAQQTEACKAARIRGEQTEQMLDARTACLDGKLAGLRALVDVLEHADAAAVEQSGAAARSLESLDGCTDLEALLSGLPPPRPDQRVGVSAARQALVRARARFWAGDSKAADEEFDAAEETISKTAYAPLDAEARLLHAQLLDDRGSYADADHEAIEAIHFAEAGRHEDVLIRAWGFHAYLLFQRLSRRADAAEAIRHATALLSARTRRDPLLEAEIEHRQGLVAGGSGDPQGAMDHYAKALALRQASLPPGHPDRIASINALGNALNRARRTTEAMERYAEALRELEQAYGPGHPGLIGPLTSTAGVYRKEGRLDDAYRAYTRALQLREKTGGREHPLLAGLLTSYSVLLLDMGRVDEAHQSIERAVAIARKSFGEDHSTMARALLTLADVEDALGDHAAALAAAEKALSIRERLRDPPQRIANAMMIVAGEQVHLGQLQAAEPLVSVALRLVDEKKDLAEVGLGRDYLARIRFEQRRKKEAAELAHSSLDLLEQAGGLERARKLLESWIAQHRL